MAIISQSMLEHVKSYKNKESKALQDRNITAQHFGIILSLSLCLSVSLSVSLSLSLYIYIYILYIYDWLPDKTINVGTNDCLQINRPVLIRRIPSSQWINITKKTWRLYMKLTNIERGGSLKEKGAVVYIYLTLLCIEKIFSSWNITILLQQHT